MRRKAEQRDGKKERNQMLVTSFKDTDSVVLLTWTVQLHEPIKSFLLEPV